GLVQHRIVWRLSDALATCSTSAPYKFLIRLGAGQVKTICIGIRAMLPKKVVATPMKKPRTVLRISPAMVTLLGSLAKEIAEFADQLTAR
ncbi:MAG: hypothetical protein ABR566_18605, partial [Pyrinomonadaceae bacterium]